MARWIERIPGLRGEAALRAAREQLTTLRRDVDVAKADHARAQQELRRCETQIARLKKLHGPATTPRRLKEILKTHSDGYRSAQPFPHIVLDDFIEPALLEAVLEEFDGMDRDLWHNTERKHERNKWSTEDVFDFGPWTRLLIWQLNAGPFLTFLEKLTGISGLIADPHLRGGGLHEIRCGGTLGVHADFNFYERLGLYRRLNLLIYLNHDWPDEWGGHLELWDRERSRCVQRISPVFNRAVLFDTSNFSYHGHPHPLACPEGRSRQSVALYYYSVAYPHDEDRAPHGTVFVDQQRI